MPRDPRAFTQPWRLIEVTTVTSQNRYLLRPSAEFNDLVIGVMARAQRKYGMQVICLTVLSTHFHILVYTRDAKKLASFMCYVKTNIAKEVGGLHDWPGGIFESRYHHVEVSDEEADQIARLKYCLANGVKELLIDRVEEWPGNQSATALMAGESLKGHWYNRTRQNAVSRGKEEQVDVDEMKFASEERLVFSPLPCWAHLPEAEYRRRVAELVDQINDEGARERKRSKRTSEGPKKILHRDPHHRPKKVKRSPRPRFHAKDHWVWKRMWEAWREIVSAFRQASARLLAGEKDIEFQFPEGTFPPHLPFVPFIDAMSIEARGQPV